MQNDAGGKADCAQDDQQHCRQGVAERKLLCAVEDGNRTVAHQKPGYK